MVEEVKRLTEQEQKEWVRGYPYSAAFTQGVVHRLSLAAAQVARLEGELAGVQTKYDRLLFTHDEVTLPMLYEADERLAAKDAALEDIAFAIEHGVDPATAKHPDPYFYTKDELIKAVGVFARAALSPDAGKGWLVLSPEAREQVAPQLRVLAREYHARHDHSSDLSTCSLGACPGNRAALDALKGVK